jgi:hypothetical protein
MARNSQINIPTIEELKAAFMAPKSDFDPSKATAQYATGMTLQDTIAAKALERQKAEEDLKKEIQAAKDAATKSAAREQVPGLLKPITQASPAAISKTVSQTPQTIPLSSVANVNPNTGDVLQTGQDIAKQAEADRPAALKGALFQAAPEQMATSVTGTQKNPTIAVNMKTGASRIVQPDSTGNFNLSPDERIKEVAMAEERAKPFSERNKILAQGLIQRGDFKSADLATRFGEKLTTGSLKGSDQVAAKNLDQITRTRQLVQQTREEQGDKITPQQVQELALGTARAITGQTVVARETIEGLLPGTLKERYGSAAQFFSSHPTPIDIHEFVTNLDNTLAREANVNKGIVTRAIRKNTSGIGQSLLKMNPGAYYQTLADARDELGNDVVDAIINERQNPEAVPAKPGSTGNPGSMDALAGILGLKKKGSK